MPAALNLLLVAILIIAAGLGGYFLAQIRSAAAQEHRAIAYRGQITRLKRAASQAEGERDQLAGHLDRAQRSVRRYELALYNQSIADEPAPAQLAHPDHTERYDTPDIAASGQFDGEVLEDVQKAVDVDRLRIHFVRRELA